MNDPQYTPFLLILDHEYLYGYIKKKISKSILSSKRTT